MDLPTAVRREREAALVTLLDDPSPTVQAALAAEFQSMGPARLNFLRVIANDPAHRAHDRAKFYIDRIVGPAPAQKLTEFIRSLSYDLETGMFLINQVIVPELQISDIRQQIDAIVARCRELMLRPISLREQCKVINRVFFHEYGFRGNSDDYENPLNSCMEAVLRTRQGLPISLSVLYLLIAERLGIELEPIGLPGHFMVACFAEAEPFYIDPFERGRFRTADEVRELLLLQNIPPDFHYLAPVAISEVLCRVCRNLAYHFDRRKQPRWANRFRVFVREFEKTHDRHPGS